MFCASVDTICDVLCSVDTSASISAMVLVHERVDDENCTNFLL